ncbi:MAG TPA: archaellar assembly protein FlaJ [Methanomicrobiales archaeon]|jgi:flagellar protein FlaJ|nr:archaellar assembly protein FlaJ [Methanomicrobiales archaeon]
MSSLFGGFSEMFRARGEWKLPLENQLKRIVGFLDTLEEEKRTPADLLFMATYMASITTAGVSRPDIFSYTGKRHEYVPSKYIAKVDYFVKRWNYSYSESLKIVAKKINNEVLQSVFNRYANSIESGVPDEEFLERELATIRSVYRNTVEQGIEMVKKWGDAYVAMLFSGVLVALIIMLSVAIFAPGGIGSTLNLSYLVVIFISAFGLITMYRSMPEDKRTHGLPDRCSREQGTIRRMERPLLIVTGLGCALLWFLGVQAGFIYLLAGILLAPLGIFGYIDDSRIIGRDSDFPTFIRTLGSVMGGKGVPMVQGFLEVDRASLPKIRDLVDSIYSKLNLGLDENQSWNRFVGESGSNNIYKYTNIFRDSVTLGGSPDKVGLIVGTSSLEQVLLRDKRHQVSMGFVSLLIPMHAAMVGILLFLFEIMANISEAMKTMMSSLGESQAAISGGSSALPSGLNVNFFMNFPVDKMATYVMIVILLITISNTIAGRIVYGGDRYIFYLFASILFIISGALSIVAPAIVTALLPITMPPMSGA